MIFVANPSQLVLAVPYDEEFEDNLVTNHSQLALEDPCDEEDNLVREGVVREDSLVSLEMSSLT